MIRYFAVWIPCLSAGEPRIIKKKGLKRVISDIESLSPCVLESTIVDSRSIDIAYSFTKQNLDSKELHFRCVHYTLSGLIEYEVDVPDDDSQMCETFTKGLHPAIYHFIKEHFHRHQFHDDECDSLLMAYQSTSPIGITQSKTAASIYDHFLKLYIEKLEGRYETVVMEYMTLRERASNAKFGTFVQEAKNLKNDAAEMRGEAAYAKALLGMSPLSLRSHIYSQLSSLFNDIEILNGRCAEIYDENKSQRDGKLAWFSIMVGLIGVAFALSVEFMHSCGNDGNAQRDELLRLKQRADSLNVENERVLRQFKP